MSARFQPALLAMALAAGLLTRPAHGQQRSTPINPPNTDFAAFERRFPWRLSPEQLADIARRQAPNNFDEAKIAPFSLPDAFTLVAGDKVETVAAWEEKRRPELLDLFRREMYGISPPKPDNLTFKVVESNPQAMGGKATFKRITIGFSVQESSFSFALLLFVPNDRSVAAPVFLLLNHRSPDNADPTRKIQSEFWPAEYAIGRGYAMAAINVADDVEPDRPGATSGLRAFYRRHAPRPEELTWGALAAWAWAGSRAIDYFERDPGINANQVAVIGHSRGGKTSLLAAAQDQRIALACVNDAGEGGPALSRRDFGERLGQITKNFPHWFVPSYANYAGKTETLPFDQHELVALIAPRGYHGADATLDLHADPRGSWLSLAEASKVWTMYGKVSAAPRDMPLVNDLFVNGPLAYHLRDGGHALTTFDWKLHLDHADRLFSKPTN